MQFHQIAQNEIKEKLEPLTPVLILVDQFSEENQGYHEKLMITFHNQFEGIQELQDAIQKILDQRTHVFTIISNASNAKCLVDIVKNKIILFCGRKQNHMDFFYQNQQIIAIEDTNFNKVLKLAEQSLQQQNLINDLITLFHPTQLQVAEYQHSKQHASIQFLVVMEELQKNLQIEEADVNWEILQLLKQKHNEATSNQLLFKMLEGVKSKQQNTTLFDKLIYYYSRDEIYSELNRTMAQSKFSEIKFIMVCLFQGYKNSSFYCKHLYRGISFGSENLFDMVIKDLHESMINQTSLYWNTLTSTSEIQQVAINFAYFNLYRIVYVIEIDEEMPHPMFKLEKWHSAVPHESEVLLFSQFQFIVTKMKQSQTLMKVYIKQVKNNFNFALDPVLRKIYWDSIINDVLRPKIKSILKYNRLRLDYTLLDRDLNFSQAKKQLQIELRHYFTEIQLIINKIVDSQQINKLIKIMIENFNVEKYNGDAQQFYEEFPKILKQLQTNLFHNLCEILIKGMINFDYCTDFLKNMSNKFYLQVTEPTRQCLQKIDEFSDSNQYKNNFLQGFFNVLVTGLRCMAIGDMLITQTKLLVDFSDKNKSTYQDGCLIDPGVRPNILWENVDERVNCIILLAQTPSKVVFCIPNLDRKKGGVFEDEELGIMIGQYRYIGPNNEDKRITFQLFGISEKYVDEDSVLTKLSQNSLQVLTSTKQVIEFNDS